MALAEVTPAPVEGDDFPPFEVRYSLPTLVRTSGVQKEVMLQPQEMPDTLVEGLLQIINKIPEEWARQIEQRILPAYAIEVPEITQDAAKRQPIDESLKFARRATAKRASEVQNEVNAWLNRTNKWHLKSWHDSVEAGTGVDIFPYVDLDSNKEHIAAMQERITGLISSLDAGMYKDVQETVWDGFLKQTPRKDMAKLLDERVGVGRSRAELIASDQANKTAAELTAIRQGEADIQMFVWSTAKDDRVRPTHAALHGKVFRWDHPPSIGLPGTPIRCRCTGRAYIPLEDYGEGLLGRARVLAGRAIKLGRTTRKRKVLQAAASWAIQREYRAFRRRQREAAAAAKAAERAAAEAARLQELQTLGSLGVPVLHKLPPPDLFEPPFPTVLNLPPAPSPALLEPPVDLEAQIRMAKTQLEPEFAALISGEPDYMARELRLAIEAEKQLDPMGKGLATASKPGKIEELVKKPDEKTHLIQPADKVKPQPFDETVYRAGLFSPESRYWYFAIDEDVAAEYGFDEAGKALAQVDSYRVRMSHPLVLDTPEKVREAWQRSEGLSVEGRFYPDQQYALNDWARSLGYDGIVVTEEAFEGDLGFEWASGTFGEPQLVAFERNQIEGFRTQTVSPSRTAGPFMGQVSPVGRLEAEAAIYEDQYEAGSIAAGPASRFTWSEEHAYPIDKIVDAPGAEWMREEIKMWAKQGEPDRFADMFKDDIREPVILVEINGKAYTWDGNHRIGASQIRGVDTVPAIVGRLKTTAPRVAPPANRSSRRYFMQAIRSDPQALKELIRTTGIEMEPHDFRLRTWGAFQSALRGLGRRDQLGEVQRMYERWRADGVIERPPPQGGDLLEALAAKEIAAKKAKPELTVAPPPGENGVLHFLRAVLADPDARRQFNKLVEFDLYNMSGVLRVASEVTWSELESRIGPEVLRAKAAFERWRLTGELDLTPEPTIGAVPGVGVTVPAHEFRSKLKEILAPIPPKEGKDSLYHFLEIYEDDEFAKQLRALTGLSDADFQELLYRPRVSFEDFIEAGVSADRAQALQTVYNEWRLTGHIDLTPSSLGVEPAVSSRVSEYLQALNMSREEFIAQWGFDPELMNVETRLLGLQGGDLLRHVEARRFFEEFEREGRVSVSARYTSHPLTSIEMQRLSSLEEGADDFIFELPGPEPGKDTFSHFLSSVYEDKELITRLREMTGLSNAAIHRLVNTEHITSSDLIRAGASQKSVDRIRDIFRNWQQTGYIDFELPPATVSAEGLVAEARAARAQVPPHEFTPTLEEGESFWADVIKHIELTGSADALDYVNQLTDLRFASAEDMLHWTWERLIKHLRESDIGTGNIDEAVQEWVQTGRFYGREITPEFQRIQRSAAPTTLTTAQVQAREDEFLLAIAQEGDEAIAKLNELVKGVLEFEAPEDLRAWNWSDIVTTVRAHEPAAARRLENELREYIRTNSVFGLDPDTGLPPAPPPRAGQLTLEGFIRQAIQRSAADREAVVKDLGGLAVRMIERATPGEPLSMKELRNAILSQRGREGWDRLQNDYTEYLRTVETPVVSSSPAIEARRQQFEELLASTPPAEVRNFTMTIRPDSRGARLIEQVTGQRWINFRNEIFGADELQRMVALLERSGSAMGNIMAGNMRDAFRNWMRYGRLDVERIKAPLPDSRSRNDFLAAIIDDSRASTDFEERTGLLLREVFDKVEDADWDTIIEAVREQAGEEAPQIIDQLVTAYNEWRNSGALFGRTAGPIEDLFGRAESVTAGRLPLTPPGAVPASAIVETAGLKEVPTNPMAYLQLRIRQNRSDMISRLGEKAVELIENTPAEGAAPADLIAIRHAVLNSGGSQAAWERVGQEYAEARRAYEQARAAQAEAAYSIETPATTEPVRRTALSFLNRISESSEDMETLRRRAGIDREVISMFTPEGGIDVDMKNLRQYILTSRGNEGWEWFRTRLNEYRERGLVLGRRREPSVFHVPSAPAAPPSPAVPPPAGRDTLSEFVRAVSQHARASTRFTQMTGLRADQLFEVDMETLSRFMARRPAGVNDFQALMAEFDEWRRTGRAFGEGVPVAPDVKLRPDQVVSLTDVADEMVKMINPGYTQDYAKQRELAAKMADLILPGLKEKGWVAYELGMTKGGPDTVYFSASWRHPESYGPITTNRSFYFNRKTVDHTFFKVPEDLQGMGDISRTMIGNLEKMYEHLGIEIITVHANIDVGGYAWARTGFVPRQDSWDHLRRNYLMPRWERFLRTEQAERLQLNPNIKPLFKAVQDILESDDPEGIFHLIDMDFPYEDPDYPKMNTIGKFLLLRSDWFGAIDRTNPDQLERFHDYLAGKKKKKL